MEIFVIDRLLYVPDATRPARDGYPVYKRISGGVISESMEFTYKQLQNYLDGHNSPTRYFKVHEGPDYTKLLEIGLFAYIEQLSEKTKAKVNEEARLEADYDKGLKKLTQKPTDAVTVEQLNKLKSGPSTNFETDIVIKEETQLLPGSTGAIDLIRKIRGIDPDKRILLDSIGADSDGVIALYRVKGKYVADEDGNELHRIRFAHPKID